MTEGGIEVDFGSNGNWNKGPITAMNFLKQATKNWTNTNEITINSFNSYDNDGNLVDDKVEMKTYNTYARMPYYNEVNSLHIHR